MKVVLALTKMNSTEDWKSLKILNQDKQATFMIQQPSIRLTNSQIEIEILNLELVKIML